MYCMCVLAHNTEPWMVKILFFLNYRNVKFKANTDIGNGNKFTLNIKL